MPGNAVLNMNRQGGIILLLLAVSLPDACFYFKGMKRGCGMVRKLVLLVTLLFLWLNRAERTPSGRKCVLKLMFPDG